MTDAYVHDWFKRAAAYARQRGVGLVLELDPRHSIPAFAQQYPKALQQRLWLREVDLAKEGEAVVEIGYGVGHGDAICGSGVNAIALERVYVYERTSAGIEPDTVQDVTASCTVRDTGTGKRSVFIPSGDAGSKERKACVIMRVTFNYPAVFSPEILQFEADTMRQYADLPLAGLMKDECGLSGGSRRQPAQERVLDLHLAGSGLCAANRWHGTWSRSLLMCSVKRGVRPNVRLPSTTLWSNRATGTPSSSRPSTSRQKPPSAPTRSWARMTRCSPTRTRASSSATG